MMFILPLLSCERVCTPEGSADARHGKKLVAVVCGRPLYDTDMSAKRGTGESKPDVLCDLIVNPLLEKHARDTKTLPTLKEVSDAQDMLRAQLHSDIAKYTARRAALLAKVEKEPTTGKFAQNEIGALETAINILRLNETDFGDSESTKKYLTKMKASQSLFQKHGGRVVIVRPTSFQQGPLPKLYPTDAYCAFLRESVRTGDLRITDSDFAAEVWNILDNNEKHEVLKPEAVDRWLNEGLKMLIESVN